MLINNKKGVINEGIKNAIGSFSYNKLLVFMPWPLRVASSFLLKNYVSNFVYDKREIIGEKAMGLLNLIKKAFSKNKSSKNEELIAAN